LIDQVDDSVDGDPFDPDTIMDGQTDDDNADDFEKDPKEVNNDDHNEGEGEEHTVQEEVRAYNCQIPGTTISL
jgi:hypothetical protein